MSYLLGTTIALAILTLSPSLAKGDSEKLERAQYGCEYVHASMTDSCTRYHVKGPSLRRCLANAERTVRACERDAKRSESR